VLLTFVNLHPHMKQWVKGRFRLTGEARSIYGLLWFLDDSNLTFKFEKKNWKVLHEIFSFFWEIYHPRKIKSTFLSIKATVG